MLSIIQAAGWPIWPLIACSILALALIIERFIALRASQIVPAQLVQEAISVTRNGLPSDKTIAQLAEDSAMGEVLATALQTLKDNPHASHEDVQAGMEATGRAVAHRLEKHLGALATIASAAPLLGLLGTVIGMIEIFGSQPGGATGTGDPGQLAHGISIALYNTAFGLIVAIPALIFWRYFRARVDSFMLNLELGAEKFARHLARLRS